MATGIGYTPVSITVSLLVVTSTLFFTFTCPWLAKNVSLAFTPCVGITFLFALANFTMATFMDAGVLPRANEDEDKDDDIRAPLYRDVEVRGIQFQMKWCASCNFYRPPRCSHCSVCDHCVEITRKFKGGANPFTRGCCGNAKFLLFGPISPRYIWKLGNKQTVHIQPPFQTLESLKMSPIKVDDNEIQTEMTSIKRQSSGELNTLLPMPPKHEPVLLKGHLAMLQENFLQTSVPTVQPTTGQNLESSSRVHFQVPREQMDHQLHMSGFVQESEMGQTEKQTPISTHLSLHSSTLPINRLILNSHSLTLKHSHCGGFQTHQCTDSVTSTSSTQGILSLSYDSLVSPAQRGTFKMNYLPPFHPLDLGVAIKCPADAQHASYHTCSPHITGTSSHSPVFYDSLSKPAMRSIQERHELEEREKQPSLLSTQDMPVYDTPSGRRLPSRRPTPPAYGSQEFLMSSAAYGYTSSLRWASRTSSSFTHANIAPQSRSLSPSAYSSLGRHVQHSASSIPCPMPSSSYTAQKTLALIAASERKDSGPYYPQSP
ncbi:palmitoyltransferase ZDHHC8B isoform X2 [Silurus meridionalis]|uniref:palmitoyltransferase ZDHHC8B isoform X2 n=1 Tax=Silurus meridionalis TaxID=175797 RepID=UPI001EEC2A7D|nr:palmitoyltransferase ZDHHC8B isoform X2 [Silurus meridionalis]